MHGFGSHTFSFWNLAGERHWVKFHWKCAQGAKNLTDAEAVVLAGENPDFSAQEFQAAIERAEFRGGASVSRSCPRRRPITADGTPSI
jgi:catalase